MKHSSISRQPLSIKVTMNNCNTLRFSRYSGERALPYYVCYRTYRDCGCGICNWWIQGEKRASTNNDRYNFGVLDSTDNEFSETIAICPNQTIKLKIFPGLASEVITIKDGDLNLEVEGNRAEKLQDMHMLKGRRYDFSVEVYSHVVRRSSVEHKPAIEQSSASVKFTPEITDTCRLAWYSRSDCKCDKYIKLRNRQKSKLFGENDDRNVYLISLVPGSVKKPVEICNHMEVRMRLVKKSQASSIRFSDLCMVVRGWRHGEVLQDKAMEGCTVKIEVLKVETTPPIENSTTGTTDTPQVLVPHTSSNQEMVETPHQQHHDIAQVASESDDAYKVEVQGDPRDSNQEMAEAPHQQHQDIAQVASESDDAYKVEVQGDPRDSNQEMVEAPHQQHHDDIAQVASESDDAYKVEVQGDPRDSNQERVVVPSQLTQIIAEEASESQDDFRLEEVIRRDPQDLNRSVETAAPLASSRSTMAVISGAPVRTPQENIELQRFDANGGVPRSPEYQDSQSDESTSSETSPPVMDLIAAPSNTVELPTTTW
ncbi:hypothetical protein EMPS_00795 [Entomortierella parvispora]|uniref:Uncharacterized protein n=1 Tax=Entomortierella parvispora TaxID=205924 RepID=A0A9P3H1S1_9FUNG|nr:hypothetical protein EMPS_00795 [Entomortierella parvispora]